MAGDPETCRKQAAKCAQLADDTRNEDLKRELTRMSEGWLTLAIELERARSSPQHHAADSHEARPGPGS